MPRGAGAVPRKRKPAKPDAKPAVRRQYNLGFTPEVAARIDATAAALGLDATQLLRMVIHEHLAEYEARAAAARPRPSE